jgi:hypothetical protein
MRCSGSSEREPDWASGGDKELLDVVEYGAPLQGEPMREDRAAPATRHLFRARHALVLDAGFGQRFLDSVA